MNRGRILIGALSLLVSAHLSTDIFAAEEMATSEYEALLSHSADSANLFMRQWRKLEDRVGQKIIQTLEIPDSSPTLRQELSFGDALQWYQQKFFNPRMRRANFLVDFRFERGGTSLIGTCQVSLSWDQLLKKGKTEITGCRYSDSKWRPVADSLIAELFPNREMKRIGVIESRDPATDSLSSLPALSATIVKESGTVPPDPSPTMRKASIGLRGANQSLFQH